MEKFKGYDSRALVEAVDFLCRSAENGEQAVSSVAKLLAGENAYDVYRKLCLTKVLRSSGIVLNDVEAWVVMECFTANDYTRQNILLVKKAFNRLNASGMENDIEAYKKFFIDYKDELRKQKEAVPVDIVIEELANISKFVNINDLDDDFGIATTLTKIRSGKVRYAQMVMNELQKDIEYFEKNCRSVINSTDINDSVGIYHFLNDALNELLTYEEMLSVDVLMGTKKLEHRAVSEVVSSLTKINEEFREVLCRSEDVYRELVKEEKRKSEEIVQKQKLSEKFERQWRTFMVHYQHILVYHNADYVVRNNPYAKRLMLALEETDAELKKLTGVSLLQNKLLEIEDRYRPIKKSGGSKIPRINVSGEDE